MKASYVLALVFTLAAFTVIASAVYLPSDDSEKVQDSSYFSAELYADQFCSDGAIEYDPESNKFIITGTLTYDADSDSWPLTVNIYSYRWYSQSISNVLVNGVAHELYQDDADCHFVYDFDIVWDESDNIVTLSIKDNSPVTSYLNFDMSQMKLQKYAVGSDYFSDLDDALDSAIESSSYVKVLKTFIKPYNYGCAVDFGNGLELISCKYNVEVVDSVFLEDIIYTTQHSLHDVSDTPANYVYKAFNGVDNVYVIQDWNLSPIKICSIECEPSIVEYNGDNQIPDTTVMDVYGHTVQLYDLIFNGDSSVTPLDAGDYIITLDQQSLMNYDASGVSSVFTIVPYDLSKGDRVKVIGTEGLVYDGSAKTVTILFDDNTQELFGLEGNEFELSAYCEQTDHEGNPQAFNDTIDDDALTVSGSVAGTHKILMIISDNFTTGVPGMPIMVFQWVICQAIISDDDYSLIWSTDGESWTTETTAVLTGTPTLAKGVDYKVMYVSIDGTRATDTLSDTAFGSWRAVATGIVNYSGSVMTDDYKTITGDIPVYNISSVTFTEHHHSMFIQFSPALIAENNLRSAELLIELVTIEVVDDVYMYSKPSISVPICTDNDVNSVYVSFDYYCTYASINLKYEYGDADVPLTVISPSYVIDTCEEQNVTEVVIVDADGNIIDGAVLIIDDTSTLNGGVILGGLQCISQLCVAYMGEYFDVSNYRIYSGKVLFDGKPFIVEDISSPTEYLAVTADKRHLQVGEIVKITPTDNNDGRAISNFTLVSYTISTLPSEANSYVTFDYRNWTLSSSVSCEVTLTLSFINQEKLLNLEFGNGGIYQTISADAENATVVIVDPYDEWEALEGQIVTFAVHADNDHILEDGPKVTDDSGNTYDVIKVGPIDDGFTAYSFTMPSVSVTITAKAILDAPAELSCSSEYWYGAGQANVRIHLAKNPGLAALRFTISYDDALELISIESGNIMSMTQGDIAANPFGMYFEYSGIGSDTSETGVLLTLSFSVADGTASGTYPITVIPVESISDDGTEFLTSTVNGSVSVSYVPGDANGDGKVSAIDSLLLRKYLANWDIELAGDMDVNNDGLINGVDSLTIRKYLANWDIELI